MVFSKNIILESNPIVSRPIFHFDEIKTIYEDVMKNLDKDLTIPKDVFLSFKTQETLCPKLWDNEKLKPEVRKKLFKIAVDFFKKLELPENIKLKDIHFVGSLANYNWSNYSDIDLHLLVDFSKFEESEEFVKKFFDAQKNLFNIKHDIKIGGHDVEIYVQNTTEKSHFGAIYSIVTDDWKKIPQKTKINLDKKLIVQKIDKLFDKLRSIKNSYKKKDYETTIEKIDKLKEQIKKMRQSGLEKGGEFSIENIVFKILRRTDFMEALDTYKNKAYDKNVSVNEEMP